MPSCAVVDCQNRQIPGCEKTFHLFPFSRPDILKQWLANMKRECWTPSKRAVLCSDHFEGYCFDKTGCTTRIRADAVPTVFSSPVNRRKTVGDKVKEKTRRTKKSHISPTKGKKSAASTKENNDVKLEIKSEEEATAALSPKRMQECSYQAVTFHAVRSSKRVRKQKQFDPEFEYEETNSKKARTKSQHQTTSSQKRQKSNVTLASSSTSEVSVEEDLSLECDPPYDHTKEEDGHTSRDSSVDNVGKESEVEDEVIRDDKDNSTDSMKNNLTDSTSAVEDDCVKSSESVIKKEINSFERSASAYHRITPRDKVTHLPNNFIHFEFATPRRQVILELNSKVESSALCSNTLQDLLSSLNDKGLLTREAEDLMSAFGALPSGLIRVNKKKHSEAMPYRKYSEEVKEFATVLFLNSPKAYELVSDVFMLPDKSILQARLQVKNYWPGFTKEALRILSSHVCKTPRDKLCSVMFDFISIKKECSFDSCSGKWIGHVDLGGGQNPIDADQIPLANEVLMFTAVGLGSDWKLPFGYFPNKGLSSELLKNLVTEAILSVEEYGLNVRAVVCNGSGINVRMGKLLGCNIHPKMSNEVITSFPHPLNQELRIHLVFGIRHTLQLLKNLLMDKGSLQSSVYGKIEWKFMKQLIGDSERGKPDFVCLSCPSHMKFYHLQSMIRKCDSIFNSTVSFALQLANQLKLDEFDNSRSTANFASDVHRSFDLLNARNPVSSEDRPPISQMTLLEQVESITNVAERILGLELLSGKRVAEDGRWMSVVLFAFTLKSVSHLAADLLNEATIQSFNTYRVNLDHVDMVLSHLQRHGCWSDVPSLADFRDAYRDLFAAAPASSFYCYDFEGEDLTVGQGDIYQYRHHFHCDKVCRSGPFLFHSLHLIDLRTDEANRANCVLQHVAQRLSCADCMRIVVDDDHSEDLESKTVNINSIRPSRFLIKLLKDSESILKVDLVESSSTVECLAFRVFREYFALRETLDLPKTSVIHYVEEPYHVICLIKVIIRTFITLRLCGRKPSRKNRWFQSA